MRNQRYLRLWTLLSVVLLSTMILGACAQPTAEVPGPTQPAAPPQATQAVATPAVATEVPMPEKPKPVVVLIPNDFNNLDPHLIPSRYPGRAGLPNIFDSLVFIDTNGKPVPKIARSWRMVDDTTWEFDIVQGATFHNGEPVNAEAAAYSLMRPMKYEELRPRCLYCDQLHLVSAEAIDEYTLRMNLEGPINPDVVLYYLYMSYIVPPKYYEEHDLAYLAENPVGSGPWRFVEWVKDDRLVLEANEDYFEGAPGFDLTFRVVPEPAAMLNELTSGNADFVFGLTPDQADIANSDVSRFVAAEGTRKVHVGIEMQNCPAPLKDVRVRQALNYAVDVEKIVEQLLAGTTHRLVSIVNEPNNNPDLQQYTYDPDRARELLAEAGYANGFDVKLQAPSSQYGADKEIVTAIVSYLEAVGLNVDVEFMETNTFNDIRASKQLDCLYYTGWAEQSFPPAELRIWQTGQGDNSGEYSNPEIDRLLSELNAETDAEAAREISYKMQQIIWDDAPWIFLWRLPIFFGFSNRFEWQTPHAMGLWPLWEATVSQ
jgi:peptide/nickel transport system substrate-binding protein